MAKFVNNGKVFVAMSGGVDSSVAAWLLKNEPGLPAGRQGYEVVGIFMRCYNLDGCQDRDAEDARRVAEKIGIPFYVWDFEEEYKRRVVDYMVEGYRQGITPNPDVMCNKEIKFGIFFDRARALGADYVATGHYVRLATRENFAFLDHASLAPTASSLQSSPVGCRKAADQAQPAASVSENKIFSLRVAHDKNKDQSYFLWTLIQDKLRHCLFPVGDYLKSEVREIARRAGLPTAEKKDSQGICFLGKVTLADFLKDYIPERNGLVLTTAGEKIGEHSGAHFYTIGQRHGLDLQSKNSELGVRGQHETKAHYVSQKDVKTNTVVVAEGDDNPALYRGELEIVSPNWISGSAPKLPVKIFARVRYRQPLSPAVFDGRELIFDSPQKFVASGQSAVFYSENGEMLGGGIIQ